MRQLRILTGYSTAVIMKFNPALRPAVFERNLPVPMGFALRLPVGLPTTQDLQFADLRISYALLESAGMRRTTGLAGFPLPPFLEARMQRLRNALFSNTRSENRPVMAYMHSLGLLNADRLSQAKQDRILIEPHPALHAMLRGMGG